MKRHTRRLSFNCGYRKLRPAYYMRTYASEQISILTYYLPSLRPPGYELYVAQNHNCLENPDLR